MAKKGGHIIDDRHSGRIGQDAYQKIPSVLKSAGRLLADPNRLSYWDVNVCNNLQFQSVYALVPALKHAGMLVYDVAAFVFEELLADAFPEVNILSAIAATDEQSLGWLARLVQIYKGCREYSEFADDDLSLRRFG